MFDRNLLAAAFFFVAIVAIFLKLPGVIEVFGGAPCLNCTSHTPYLPLMAVAYFSALLATTLAFSLFPNKNVAKIGLTWALGLAFSLTYLAPEWCYVCLIAHAFHLAGWAIFLFIPQTKTDKKDFSFGLKLLLVLTTSVAMTALFSTLNFTFLLYGLVQENPFAKLVQKGQKLNDFIIHDKNIALYDQSSNKEGKKLVMTFVSPTCTHCKEILPQLNQVAEKFKDVLFFNLGRQFTDEMRLMAPAVSWAQDEKANLFTFFGVTVFPTTVIISSEGEVIDAFVGSPKDYSARISKSLKN